jgi:hypothetical protein
MKNPMKFNNNLLKNCRILLSCFIFCTLFQYSTIAQNVKEKAWIQADPFNTSVFIENHGQFDNWTTAVGQIKYAVNKSDKIFFSASGLTYRLEKVERKEEYKLKEQDSPAANKSREEEKEHPEVDIYAVHMIWLGSNPDAEIIASGESYNYYTFGEKGFENVKARGYKKILYKNLYPDIDVEYTIPEKGGIKYTIILHPGADASKVKMEYTGDVNSISKNSDGNIIISTPAGDIIDHAPVSYYETGNKTIISSFKISNGIVCFTLPENYDSQSSVIIDPWTVTPTSLTTDFSAYDINCDDNGNVYVTGGVYPYKLAKYDASGTLLWTFTTPTGFGSTYGYYGGFCVIPSSGTVFIGEGWNSIGPTVLKVSSDGGLVYTTPNLIGNQEIWVMFYNRFNGKLFGFGGGTANSNSVQIFSDTSLTSSTCINFNGNTSADNDISAAEEDYNGDFYALMSSIVAGSDNGMLMKSLTSTNFAAPPAWETTTGYNSAECYNYGIPGFSTDKTVRTNALALNDDYIFCYDGKKLSAFNKTNGTLLNTVIVNAAYADGQNRTHEGIAADDCNSIYVGGNGIVHIYTFDGTTFTFFDTIPVNNEVYDIQLNKMTGNLYVCGSGFVSSFTAPIPCSLILVQECSGDSAVIYAPSVFSSYLWSTGDTTSSIVIPNPVYGDSISVTCIDEYGGVFSFDTIITVQPVTNMTLNSVTICSGDSATLTAPGTYSYFWNTGQTGSSITVGPSSTTVYTVTAVSNGGCAAIASATVTVGGFTTPPEICLVTVDTSSNHNMIVWEKPFTGAIDQYYIYRESSISGIYNLIGAQNYSDYSTYIDTSSNSLQQPYRYKLAINDSCGTLSQAGNYHQTIHLTVNAGSGGSWNLLWNDYEGFTFSTYNIYRGISSSNMILLNSVASTVTSYSDLTPPPGFMYYLIEAVKPAPCNPLIKSGESISSTISNIANTIGLGNNEFSESGNIGIYPNPIKDEMTVTGTLLVNSQMDIMNALGQKIFSTRLASTTNIIDVSGFSHGIYFLSIKGDTFVICNKILIQ